MPKRTIKRRKLHTKESMDTDEDVKKNQKKEGSRKRADNRYIDMESIINVMGSTRDTAQGQDGKTSRHEFPAEFQVLIPASEIGDRTFTFVEKNGDVPEYSWVRVKSVNINLRDELVPNEDGSVTGLAVIKARKVTKRKRVEIYPYLNIFPLPEKQTLETMFMVTINKEDEWPQKGSFHFGPSRGTYNKVYVHLNLL